MVKDLLYRGFFFFYRGFIFLQKHEFLEIKSKWSIVVSLKTPAWFWFPLFSPVNHILVCST